MGISQEELAHRAEISRNYVGLLELGQRSPALPVIFALAEALAESPSGLLAAVESQVQAARTPPRVTGPGERRRGRAYLPLYSLEAAAGQFLDNRPVEVEGWVEAPEGLRVRDGMFVTHVRGRSMEPLLADGALAVFRAGAAGDREGRVLLVQLLTAEDPEGGAAFTVKRWHSAKEPAPESEGGWRHTAIELRPLNPDFRPIKVRREDELRVIAELVRAL
jgi:transcriptional regulator with XRE-family HTH domain